MNKALAVSLFAINIYIFSLFLVTQHFPLFALLFHIISICIVVIWIVYDKLRVLNIKKYWLDFALLIGLFIFAFILYLYKVDSITPGIQGDEVTIAKAGEYVLSLKEYTPFIDINYGHATPLLYLTGVSIHWLGRSLVAIRLPSILFGAASISVFYILLRLFFRKTISFITALLFLFSYPFITVSRLAFEITPSVFFQIVTVIFLFLAWKKKKSRYFAAIGLFLGAGLYTYVGFRTFALVIFSLIGWYFTKTYKQNKKTVNDLAFFLLAFFIVTAPLLSYSIGHVNQIVARQVSLSLFHQGLPASEIAKELQGATFRLTNLFLPTGNLTETPVGDPSLKQNPSQVTMFDFITFLIFTNGFILLWMKKRKLFWLITFFSLAPIINDIFSLERIPEGHYYGIGHPNTLRIAGIIPLVYFTLAYGFHYLKVWLDRINQGIYLSVLLIISGIIILFNWTIYFNQPFSAYDYLYNGVKMLNVAKAINKTSAENIYLSPSLITDERVNYFTTRKVRFTSYTPKTIEQIVADHTSKDLLIIDPDFDATLGKKFLQTLQSQPDLLNHGVKLLTSPDNKVDTFMLIKSNM